MHVADPSAGFEQHRQASGHVPGLQPDLPEPLQSAARHRADVERRRPDAARAVRRHGHLLEVEKKFGLLVRLDGGKPVEYSPFSKRSIPETRIRRLFRYAPPPPLGREQLLVNRVVDHPRYAFTVLLEADADRELWQTVREVRRPVQRVDVPDVLRAAIDAAALLGHDSNGSEIATSNA